MNVFAWFHGVIDLILLFTKCLWLYRYSRLDYVKERVKCSKPETAFSVRTAYKVVPSLASGSLNF